MTSKQERIAPAPAGAFAFLPQFADITWLHEWSHSIGSLYHPGMQLSFEDSWRQEVTVALEKKLGDLGELAAEIIELTMILTLVGERDGLVELLA